MSRPCPSRRRSRDLAATPAMPPPRPAWAAARSTGGYSDMACWGPVMNASDKPALLSHEGRVVLLALLAGLPGSAIALWVLWSGDYSTKVQWTLSVLISGAWLGFALAARERVVFPLQTISNLLGALREGDFSVRGRSPRPDDALGEVMREVNTLGSTLREQRLGAMEATTLLRTVMREIAVAIFAFDEKQRLRLVNRAGERLLAAPAERLLGQTAAELHLEVCLEGPAVTTLQTVFPGGAGIPPRVLPRGPRRHPPADRVPRRRRPVGDAPHADPRARSAARTAGDCRSHPGRSEEHTSELQSLRHLV